MCLFSGVPIRYEYIDDEANGGRMGARMMAVVVEGDRGRVYLEATSAMEGVARRAQPEWRPDLPSRGTWASNAQGRRYGFFTFGDYYTPRQLVALTTFSDLVSEAREHIRFDAVAAGQLDDGFPLRDGGTGVTAYAEAVAVYLALGISRLSDIQNSLCMWENTRTQVRHLFTRQAIPILWDYAEANLFADAAGDFAVTLGSILNVLRRVMNSGWGHSFQCDAATFSSHGTPVISTDPPYYDNIGYADLSDFFYVWLRRSLRPIFPDLFATLATPKAEELVATPFRHDTKKEAEEFFLNGMTKAIARFAQQAHPICPVTIYYAFKQLEKKGDTGNISTGWETFLGAVIDAGFAIRGTWPMRTELSNRPVAGGANALASSIVLACRARPSNALIATRREFVEALKEELPPALRTMQAGNIAPVDLAQAAIGPGMAVFSRYARVLDVGGKPLTVRDTLSLINQTLEEALAEQEGDFDADTRWATAWFEQAGFNQGDFGIAETLSKAKNTSVDGMIEAGILNAGGGKVRLLRPDELPDDWDPRNRHPAAPSGKWSINLIRVHSKYGEAGAAELLAKLRARRRVRPRTRLPPLPHLRTEEPRPRKP